MLIKLFPRGQDDRHTQETLQNARDLLRRFPGNSPILQHVRECFNCALSSSSNDLAAAALATKEPPQPNPHQQRLLEQMLQAQRDFASSNQQLFDECESEDDEMDGNVETLAAQKCLLCHGDVRNGDGGFLANIQLSHPLRHLNRCSIIVSSCHHTMHLQCHKLHVESTTQGESSLLDMEFSCPLCREWCNVVLPISRPTAEPILPPPTTPPPPSHLQLFADFLSSTAPLESIPHHSFSPILTDKIYSSLHSPSYLQSLTRDWSWMCLECSANSLALHSSSTSDHERLFFSNLIHLSHAPNTTRSTAKKSTHFDTFCSTHQHSPEFERRSALSLPASELFAIFLTDVDLVPFLRIDSVKGEFFPLFMCQLILSMLFNGTGTFTTASSQPTHFLAPYNSIDPLTYVEANQDEIASLRNYMLQILNLLRDKCPFFADAAISEFNQNIFDADAMRVFSIRCTHFCRTINLMGDFVDPKIFIRDWKQVALGADTRAAVSSWCDSFAQMIKGSTTNPNSVPEQPRTLLLAGVNVTKLQQCFYYSPPFQPLQQPLIELPDTLDSLITSLSACLECGFKSQMICLICGERQFECCKGDQSEEYRAHTRRLACFCFFVVFIFCLYFQILVNSCEDFIAKMAGVVPAVQFSYAPYIN